MLNKLTHVNVWVHDQDEALAFYTEKLGMELRDDVTLPELGGFRWLTVGPPGQEDVALALMTVPDFFEVDTKSMLKELLGRGVLGGLFFTVDNCQQAFEELKGRGVEFSQEPTQQPYGIDAGFRDSSGNAFRMMQTPDAA
jgi:catechol 2,3-dioxygenase-like lactoylglutathione lyase family enzyme